ncbi:hypothetical protein, partial [Actinomadura roseirufa]|uniref:hypothetical protein n=1 Tax=Actinomadura roseirufa TaxID=2094049 RepID=UPI001041233F
MQATVQAALLVCLCGLAAVDVVLRAVMPRRPRVPDRRAGGDVLHAVAEAAACLASGRDPHAAARH